MADGYTYRVSWSEEDREYVGTCLEFPSLSHLSERQEDALRGIKDLVRDVLAELQAIDDLLRDMAEETTAVMPPHPKGRGGITGLPHDLVAAMKEAIHDVHVDLDEPIDGDVAL